MHFLSPIFLWGLLGLSIPVAIHFLSRKEGKIIRIGSLRHVEETTTKQFRGIKLNELLLLALRSLLIVLFCLLISGLYWKTGDAKKWVLIEKGLEHHSEITLDSLRKNGYQTRWLTSGFPLMTNGDTTSRTADIDYKTALKKLEAEKVERAVIFSTNNPQKLIGSRISLPAFVQWINIPSEKADFNLATYSTGNDSVVVRSGHSDNNLTEFRNETSFSPSEKKELRSVDILIVADEDYKYDMSIIGAALRAIDKQFGIQIKPMRRDFEKDAPSRYDSWAIILSKRGVPSDYKKTITMTPGSERDLVVKKGTNQWIITKKLNEQIAVENDLPLRLAEIILPDRNMLVTKASLSDRRSLPDSVLWSSNETPIESGPYSVETSASGWLIAMLLITLVTERFIAFKRNQ